MVFIVTTKTKKNLVYQLYKIKNNLPANVDGFPKLVNGFNSNDVIYVALNYLNKANISTLTTTLDSFTGNLDKDYNDLALERTTFGVIPPKNDNPTLPPEGGGHSCGVLPGCLNGGYGTCWMGRCLYYGWGTSDAAINEYADDNGITSGNSLISTQKLDDFRDNILLSSVKGRKLSELCYVINGHFYASINTNVLLKSVPVAQDLNIIIDRLMDEDYNGIIFPQNFTIKVEDLMDESISNSNSPEYHEDVPLLVRELKSFNNLNKINFLSKLNDE